MADPATIAVTGMAASAVGGIVGAIGSTYKGEAEGNLYEYQAGIAKRNQQIALQNADYERYVGEVKAQESGMRTRAQIGETKAIQAASGFDVNTGSPSAVRTSEREIGFQDQSIIRSSAARRAFGYEVEAQSQDTQSNIYKMGAKNARFAGNIGAVSSILGGASSVASKWGQYKSNFGSSSSSVNVGSATSF